VVKDAEIYLSSLLDKNADQPNNSEFRENISEEIQNYDK